MQLFITILHIILAITMILIILLQPGKEGGAALAGGSSGNQMYGPRGAGNFLGKATTVVATMFMFTSISLAWYSSEKIQSGSDIGDAIQRLEGGEDEEGFGIPMPAAPEAPPVEIEPIDPDQDAQEAKDAGEEAPVGVPASESTEGDGAGASGATTTEPSE
jgi:preprotein translocase subunit SecG